MKKSISFALTIGCIILAICCVLALSQKAAVSQGMPTKESGQDCLDPIDKCKKPVKFIEKTGVCYTFACEYGTKNEHLAHTSKKEDVKQMFQWENESKPALEKPVPR